MSAQLHVLVVEDNPVNQKVVVGLLTKWGHRAVVACDGALGLAALAQHEFDLVLMDIQMPVMDGIAATRAIRARELEHGGHIPIIAITAHAAVQDRTRCLEAGADRYLTKPLNSELLKQAISEFFPSTLAAPAPAPSVAGGGPVDFEQLVEFVGDDPILLAEVIQVFLDDSPTTLESVARSIADSDAAALEVSSHRLKGSLATMGAPAAAETANILETMGRERAIDDALGLCERLRTEVEAVSESLRTWKRQSAA